MSFKIGGQLIGKNYPVYFIADIASNHNGDLGKAKELIYAGAESGVNAIKMQNFRANSIVSDHGFKTLSGIDTHQSKWQTSVFDSYDAASIPLEWTQELKSLSEKLGLDYFTSPYSLKLTKAVAPYVSAFKLGSGDITWHEQIKLMSSFRKPILIATGASNLEEVKMAVQVAQKETDEIILMQCNTNYTATHGEDEALTRERFSNINLKVLQTYADIWPKMLLGLSDHTHGNLTVLAAVGLYDCVAVEKHFTLDSSQKGQDHAFSMMPHEWRNMVKKTKILKETLNTDDDFKTRYQAVKNITEDAKFLHLIIGDGVKKVSKNEENTIIVQRRAIRAKKKLAKGRKLHKDDIEFLRPCPKDALPPHAAAKILGKSLRRSITKGDFITTADLV